MRQHLLHPQALAVNDLAYVSPGVWTAITHHDSAQGRSQGGKLAAPRDDTLAGGL
jgi:hypothetical protein